MGKGKLSHSSLLLKWPLNHAEVGAEGICPLPALSISLWTSNMQVAWKSCSWKSPVLTHCVRMVHVNVYTWFWEVAQHFKWVGPVKSESVLALPLQAVTFVWPFWAASAIKTAVEIFPFLFQFYFLLFFFCWLRRLNLMNQRGVEAEGMWDVLCHSHSCQSLGPCPIKPHPKEGGRGLRHTFDKLDVGQTLLIAGFNF